MFEWLKPARAEERRPVPEDVSEYWVNRVFREALKDHALDYAQFGLALIPIPYMEEGPSYKNWKQAQLESDEIDSESIVEDPNIALVLGDLSCGVIDVELGCDEAIKVAPSFLPQTGFKFGRDSRPSSHWIYRTEDPGNPITFKDPDANEDGTVILEYRANGCCTLFPSSVHPSGELIEFTPDAQDEPDEVSRDDLLQCLGKLAAAVLLVRQWQKGQQQELASALAGALLGSGLQVEEVKLLVKAVCEAANDEEVSDRLRAVETSAERLERGETVSGWPALEEMIKPAIASKMREWLQLDVSHSPQCTDRLAAHNGAERMDLNAA